MLLATMSWQVLDHVMKTLLQQDTEMLTEHGSYVRSNPRALSYCMKVTTVKALLQKSISVFQNL